MTSDVEKRINEHNAGREKTTRPYAPFELIFTEDCKSRPAARIREKYWKSGVGKEKLPAIRAKKQMK